MQYRTYYGIVLFLLSFLVSSLAAKPTINIEETPDWVNPLSFEKTFKKDSGSVRYHRYNSQTNHQLNKKHAYYEFIMEPVNKQGIKEISELKFSFYPAYETLTFHHINVIRDGKMHNRLDKTQFKLFQSEDELSNKIYSEKWNALFILEDIRPNDVIQYSYTIKGNNPILPRHDFGFLYLNWGVPVEHIYVNVKSIEKLNYRFTNGSQTVHTTKNNQGYSYTIDLKNVPAGPNDTQYPYWHEAYNLFQYSGIQSWQEVNQWAVELYDIDLSLPGELIAQIDQWKQELGQAGAINKIIEFVQDDIRYFGIELGINSHLPRTPQEILKKRYGDCKDKAVLMTAMLKQINIKAYPALVSSRRGKGIIQDLPSPFSFDHVISHFKFKGKEYWVDGTVTSQRGNLQQKGFINYDYALVLKNNQKRLKAIKATYEGQDVSRSYTEETFNISPAENKAQLNVISQYEGLKAEELRRFFYRNTPENAHSNLLDYYAKFYPEINSDAQYVLNDNRENNQLAIDEAYNINNFASIDSARKIFKIYAPTITTQLYKPEKVNRKTPMALGHPILLTHKVNAKIHGNILWNDPLDKISIDNQWFEFSRESKKTGNQIEVLFHFKSLSDHVKSENVALYLDELDKIEAATHFSFWAKGQKSQQSLAKKNMKNLIKSLIKKK